MSQRITLSIPEPLAARIEEHRGDQSLQDYALAALRAAVYGSTAEQALRAEVARLHATVRALGGAISVQAVPAAPRPEEDVRKGW
jgi:hypothetical protein